jgi:hypothetical protein
MFKLAFVCVPLTGDLPELHVYMFHHIEQPGENGHGGGGQLGVAGVFEFVCIAV